MEKWGRFLYQPCMPIGIDGRRITGSKEHIALSREAATEGMVLLKNDHKVLPLKRGANIALFGKGCVDYVKGGGGSGGVHCAYVRNLVEGMRIKQQEEKIHIYEPLASFYEEEIAKQYARGSVSGMTIEPEIPEDILEGAKAFTDTAVVSICRFSGEGWDRVTEKQEIRLEDNVPEEQMVNDSARIFEKGDFYLTVREQKMIDCVMQNFAKVIVVLNIGGMMSADWFKEEEHIQAVLLSGQAGMEGGLATADILLGEKNPSGKLTDTFAKQLSDYPSSYNFHESDDYVAYSEDIYVGYRYFETIPKAAEMVNYPFGYGLSYTEFKIEEKHISMDDKQVEVICKVHNIGNYAGKEVVQLYVSAPMGLLGKPAKELKAFAKTRLLLPGESEELCLTVPVAQLASYDDLGKVQKSAYVLEKGIYRFWLGNNVRDAKQLAFQKEIAQDLIIEQLSPKCVPNMLEERLLADGTMEQLETNPDAVHISVWDSEHCTSNLPDILPETNRKFGEKPTCHQFVEVAEGTCSMEQFMEQFSIDEIIQLLCGHDNTGVANTCGYGANIKFGVPNVMTADGPAGLRIKQKCCVDTTAFPCATTLASSWNEALIEQVGEAGAKEVVENNIGVWLTPAMNIHRSPLCGRNFEYYSEDPLLSGKIGAALVRGIQSQKIAASVKHFACNNKETNRTESDSRVSERALREIYLKGFEIVVKEADPWTIMTAYNCLNGYRTSENKDLITGILREEWGFQGMVTTDWWNHAEQYLEIKAGNDVKMGCGYPERLKKDFEEGRISEEELRTSAKRVLELILKFN